MDAESLLEALAIPTITIDREGRVCQANGAAVRLLARSRAALVGQPLTALVPPRIHFVEGKPLAAYLAAHARAQHERPVRMPALRGDGVVLEVEFAQAAVPGPEGLTVLSLQQRPESVDYAVERIGLGDRETPDEQALRYRLVFEHAPLGILHFDARGVITACNDVFVRLIGSSHRLLIGLDMTTLHDARIVDCVRRALAGERTHYEGDYHSATAPKVTPVRVDFAPIRNGGGRTIGGVGIVEDITERKRAEDERTRLLAKERAARVAAEDALRAREEFLSVASHELRTPLTSVRLAIENLDDLAGKGQLAQAPEALVRKSLQAAVRQVRHLARLVDDLLDVSRIQAGKLELRPADADLSEVVRGVVARTEAQIAAAGCSLSVEAEPTPGRFDRALVEQVVTNLLSNALKFGAGKVIDVRVRSDGDALMLTVRDRGIGIASDEQTRIFERFERAVSARNYGGLGLGLYIARRIVEAHGGQISVESQPGQGALFTVRLPRAPGLQ